MIPALISEELLPVAGPTPAEMRAHIFSLEAEILKLPQTDLPLRHYFAKGLYAREMLIPEGTVLTGKIHTTEHLCFITKGSISVLAEEGMRRINAPAILISKPGAKRAGFAHEDTIFVTVHATEETDLEKLEAELTAESFEDPRLPISLVPQLEESICHSP